VEVTDADGWTAFLLACDNCSNDEGEAIIRLLAASGANLEARTNDGDTSLHRACMKVPIPCFKTLLLNVQNP
jgi:ankyrin repeat protein